MSEFQLGRMLQRAAKAAELFVPVSMLLVRLSLGIMFAQTGWGKLQNLERTVDYFASLGIPLPHFHAVLVGSVELIGGVLLALGLLTRLAAVPLMGTMMVAILTALLPDVEGIVDLLALDETLYLAILLFLVAGGAGRWSIDAVLVPQLSFLAGTEAGTEVSQSVST